MTLNLILNRSDINIALILLIPDGLNTFSCPPRAPGSDTSPEYCPDNGIDEPNLFYFTPHFMKVIGLFIIIPYLLDYYTTPVTRRTKSPFYDILSFYCVVLLTRTGFTTSVALVLRVTDEFTTTELVESGPQFVLIQVCMYLDWIGDDFSMVMIFLMALNRCLHFAAKDISQQIFGKRTIPISRNLIIDKEQLGVKLGIAMTPVCPPKFDMFHQMTIGCDSAISNESVLLFLIPIAIKILGLIIIVLFLINYYSIPITQRTKSPFYDILGFYCVVLMSRTAFSTTVVLVLRLIDELTERPDKLEESGPQYVLVQVCMYLDWIGDDFSTVMIFLMALNRCLHFAAKNVSQRIFGK